MSSCYSDDHIAREPIHTDKTRYSIEVQQQKYAFERPVIDYCFLCFFSCVCVWGGGGNASTSLTASKKLPFASTLVRSISLPSMNQYRKQTSHA